MSIANLIFQTPIIGYVVISLLYIVVSASYPFRKLKLFVFKNGGSSAAQRAYVHLTHSPTTFWGVTIVGVALAVAGEAQVSVSGVSPHALFVASFLLMGWALFMWILYLLNATLMYMAAGGRL